MGEGSGSFGLTRIDVLVTWGADWSGAMTKAQMRKLLVATLDQQTELYRIDFEDTKGGSIGVTFGVGPNNYGPFFARSDG